MPYRNRLESPLRFLIIQRLFHSRGEISVNIVPCSVMVHTCTFVESYSKWCLLKGYCLYYLSLFRITQEGHRTVSPVSGIMLVWNVTNYLQQ